MTTTTTRARAGVVDLLRSGCFASLPATTIESLIEGGRIGEFPAGFTVYSEADVEGLAVILADLRADKLVRTAPGRVEIVDPVRLSRELWSRGQKNGGPEGPPDVTRQRRLPA